MKHTTLRHAAAIALTLLATSHGASHAASLGASGLSENFDAMGSSGTTPPDGWAVYTGPSGTSNSTWTTSITAAGVAAMVPTTAGLSAVTMPAGTNNNGFNAAASASTVNDRLIATSPTTVSGSALQFSFINDTGAALTGLTVNYDTVRFTSVSSAGELPGYWLFVSLDGSSWSNVDALTPTATTVPNTIGITSSAGSFSFDAPVANGASVWLRWVDDNARQTSPDQIIGLDNLNVSAVPEPTTSALALAGIAALALRRRFGRA